MTTKYYVASSDGRTSLNSAIADVQREVQAYLDKGGKLHGGVSISGFYEDDVTRYAVAQALVIEE